MESSLKKRITKIEIDGEIKRKRSFNNLKDANNFLNEIALSLNSYACRKIWFKLYFEDGFVYTSSKMEIMFHDFGKDDLIKRHIDLHWDYYTTKAPESFRYSPEKLEVINYFKENYYYSEKDNWNSWRLE